MGLRQEIEKQRAEQTSTTGKSRIDRARQAEKVKSKELEKRKANDAAECKDTYWREDSRPVVACSWCVCHKINRGSSAEHRSERKREAKAGGKLESGSILSR